MQSNWSDEQREVIAERAREIDRVKARVLPTQQTTVSSTAGPPQRPWSYRKTRLILLSLLFFGNVAHLGKAAHRVFTRPDSVSLLFSDDQVRVNKAADGTTSYQVQVPLKQLPYQAVLDQPNRLDTLSPFLFNLVLLGALLHSYWIESRANSDQAQA
ncbi:MAG: hypothetical protein KDA63_10675 [Planctomycetales bacterium]|nr:hypothetical protein [Planctomycetales bacterium]